VRLLATPKPISKKNDPFGNVEFLQDAMMLLVNKRIFDVERIMNDILGNPNRFCNVFQGLVVRKEIGAILDSYLHAQSDFKFPNEQIFGLLIMDVLIWMKMEGINARKAVEEGYKLYQSRVKANEKTKDKGTGKEVP